MLKKFMFTCGYILHRLNPLWGTKLARSTFLLAHASLWLERSGATTLPLVPLLSAVLLRRMLPVATWPFRVRPK